MKYFFKNLWMAIKLFLNLGFLAAVLFAIWYSDFIRWDLAGYIIRLGISWLMVMVNIAFVKIYKIRIKSDFIKTDMIYRLAMLKKGKDNGSI